MIFSVLKIILGKLSIVRNFDYEICLKLAIFFVILLWGMIVFVNGEEIVRFHLGPELKIEPGQGKTTGLGELHWGLENENLYGALAIGVASKSIVSSNLFKNLDIIDELNIMAKPENEFYFGAVIDSVIPILSGPSEFYYVLAGGPKIPSGFGCSIRGESILNILPRKTEKDRISYWENNLYMSVYLGTKLMAIRPMIGFGYNERLDSHFINEDLSKDEILRWKFRADLTTKNITKIGNLGFRFFMIVQHERPLKENMSVLQLENGSLAKVQIPHETSIRLGILIDLTPFLRGENAEKTNANVKTRQ